MNKRILCALSAGALLADPAPAAYAADAAPEPVKVTTVSETAITPRADVIVYKTRTYNGKRQYRRWNQTQGYWVDPDWIDA